MGIDEARHDGPATQIDRGDSGPVPLRGAPDPGHATGGDRQRRVVDAPQFGLGRPASRARTGGRDQLSDARRQQIDGIVGAGRPIHPRTAVHRSNTARVATNALRPLGSSVGASSTTSAPTIRLRSATLTSSAARSR